MTLRLKDEVCPILKPERSGSRPLRSSRAGVTRSGGPRECPSEASGEIASTSSLQGKEVIFHWRSHLKADSRKLKLSIPKTRLKKGHYKLALKATAANSRRVQRKLKLNVPAKLKRV